MNKRWKPNVTVAAMIECTLDGIQKFLLVEEETRDGLRLNNPAGHLDPGESPQQACARKRWKKPLFTSRQRPWSAFICHALSASSPATPNRWT